jgi:hypothetical protein
VFLPSAVITQHHQPNEVNVVEEIKGILGALQMVVYINFSLKVYRDVIEVILVNIDGR